MTARVLGLFEGYGIEVEAAVVDAESLEVRPVVDALLREAAGTGEWVEDVDDGPIGWSNELVNHVVELKTNGPVPSFDGVADAFLASAARLNDYLARGWGARLMPGGMHPWMEPTREARLWPHDHGPVYRAFDRLFDCRRHGWANLQSVHLNLPFAGEAELARLLAAIRLVLPLIPALAASSPFVEGRATGRLDNRLDVYRTNAARVPSITGHVIPEPVYTVARYRTEILGAIDAELADAGADPVLRGVEWTNARGAIVRFDRDAVEIRLIDAQESPRSDLAVAAAVSGAVQGLVEERWSAHARQREWPTEDLVARLDAVLEHGRRAELPDAYAALFGARGVTAGELWVRLTEAAFPGSADLEPALATIHARGVLAERLLAAVGPVVDRDRLRDAYAELCACFDAGAPFAP